MSNIFCASNSQPLLIYYIAGPPAAQLVFACGAKKEDCREAILF
jgi:hypothetical protein